MEPENKLYRRALNLSLFTVFYNVIEGVVSMMMGFQDESLALFGFGVDSFIEVLIRSWNNGNGFKDKTKSE